MSQIKVTAAKDLLCSNKKIRTPIVCGFVIEFLMAQHRERASKRRYFLVVIRFFFWACLSHSAFYLYKELGRYDATDQKDRDIFSSRICINPLCYQKEKLSNRKCVIEDIEYLYCTCMLCIIKLIPSFLLPLKTYVIGFNVKPVVK